MNSHQDSLVPDGHMEAAFLVARPGQKVGEAVLAPFPAEEVNLHFVDEKDYTPKSAPSPIVPSPLVRIIRADEAVNPQPSALGGEVGPEEPLETADARVQTAPAPAAPEIPAPSTPAAKTKPKNQPTKSSRR